MQSCKNCGASWETNKIMERCPFCNADLREKKVITTMEDAFRVIMEKHGRETFMNGGKLMKLLNDYAPTLSKEMRLVKLAIEIGAYKEIVQTQINDVDMVVSKYTSIMENEYFIGEEKARESLMWCVGALGNSGKNVAPDEADLADFEIEGNRFICYNGQNSIVHIPNGVVEICEYAFSNCSELKEVIIPSSVKVIKKNAFDLCSSLVRVIFSEGLERIEDCAFINCSELKEAIIPSSVQTINSCAFMNCRSLERLVFSEGLKCIGYGAFAGCASLKEIELPDSLVGIGGGAFASCEDLEAIKIPLGIHEIKRDTFNYCYNLERIIAPKNIVIDSEASDYNIIPKIEYYD
jgi:hypothetical protein